MQIKPNIIFEDNQIIVVVKPHNIAVQADESQDLALLDALKNFIKERDNKPGNVFIGLVHRLDRPTGGLMVFAKTSKSAARLSKQIREKQMQKTYLCVVNGRPKQTSGRLECYLKKDKANNIVKIVPKLETDAKQAVLNFEILATKNKLSLVKVELETGRSHQIRAQFSGLLQTPIYADFKYGDSSHTGNLALWAYKLVFEHPVSKKQLKFVSQPSNTSPAFKLFENEITLLLDAEKI